VKLAEEHPHPETPLEWWFFQGFYEGPHIERKHFMLSFFRQKIERELPKEDTQVFYLIKSITDSKDNTFHFTSQINNDVLENLKEKKNFLLLQNESGNLDPVLFKAYMDEIKTYGPPFPIKVSLEPVYCKADSLDIEWADFSLKQKKGTLLMSFEDPELNKLTQMKLTPLKKVLHINDYEIPNLESTYYNTYPKMKLSGKAHLSPITGRVWMDHQWGDFKNWFLSKSDKKNYLGWDWIGFNLDDGSDIIITTHRNMEKNEIIDRMVFYIPPNSNPRVLSNVTMKPTGFWKSPRTHAVFPVNWNIQIPELEIELDFFPFLKEQEIPFFGVIRAIWEGAGQVKGFKENKEISGLARLELHGYCYLFAFNKYLKTFSDKIDKLIESFLPRKFNKKKKEQFVGKPTWDHDPDALTEMLSKPFWDMNSRKGKRWRPLFGLLALESLGVNPEPYEQLICCTMEINHVASLIIDDIEDKSSIRRGEECIHLRYGEDLSINAGCTLYFLPFLLIERHPYLNETQKRKLYEIMNKTMIKAHFGQAMDIFWSKNLTRKKFQNWSRNSLGDKILQMYAYKTGAAVAGGSEVACVIAETNEKIYNTFKSMALTFGTAFQIIDDIHNFNTSPEWTKQTGEDISSGKLTYVIYKAIQNSTKQESEKLLSILCSKERRKETGNIKTASQIIRESGALSLCKKEATEMIEREWKKFSKLIPVTEAKIQMRLMITGLINFSYNT
jgi:geranylgeranyl pyrophosphate synthase/predicted secreted hydrolase